VLLLTKKYKVLPDRSNFFEEKKLDITYHYVPSKAFFYSTSSEALFSFLQSLLNFFEGSGKIKNRPFISSFFVV